MGAVAQLDLSAIHARYRRWTLAVCSRSEWALIALAHNRLRSTGPNSAPP